MSLRNRIEKLFDVFRVGRLFGAATMDDLAFGRYFSKPEVRRKRPESPDNVRRLAACMGMRVMWTRFKGRKPYSESERAAALAKLGLTDPVSLDQIRDRMIDLAGTELGFASDEVAFLARGLRNTPEAVTG
jgi:hypothetical protein